MQAFPGPGGKWQISTNGGSEPHWAPDGNKLYYLTPGSRMTEVEVETGETFEAGIPEPIFPVTLRPILTHNRFLIAPDGERFLLLSSLREATTPPTTVVLDWIAELGHE